MRRLDPEFDIRLQDLANAYVRYFALRRDLAATLVTDPALTLEYTYAEPALQPKLHNAKLAWAFSPHPKGAAGVPHPGTLSVNAGLDLFHTPQPTGESLNTSRWKDAQLALQFDRSVGQPDSAAQLSIGAYYQYQMHSGVITIPDGDAILPQANIPVPPKGAKLLAEKGSIVLLQATVVFQKPGGGLKIPIGFSWSNRTELATGNIVRGHIGFTFDSSPLALITGIK